MIGFEMGNIPGLWPSGLTSLGNPKFQSLSSDDSTTMGQSAFPICTANTHRQGKKGGQPVALEQGTGTKVGDRNDPWDDWELKNG